jgi:hypothetical protein
MSDSRKAWGYDKLIELLEQHKLEESIEKTIRIIRKVAEKEEDDNDKDDG